MFSGSAPAYDCGNRVEFPGSGEGAWDERRGTDGNERWNRQYLCGSAGGALNSLPANHDYGCALYRPLV